MRCRIEAQKRFFINPKAEKMCNYFDEVSRVCGQKFNLCYDGPRLQRIQDVMLRVEVERLMKVKDLERN